MAGGLRFFFVFFCECVFNETLWRVEFHTKKFNLKLSEQVNIDRAIAMDQNTCVQM